MLSWARPRELDTIPAPGPYEYIIYRSDLDPLGNNLQEKYRFTTTDLNDTTYIDSPINTISGSSNPLTTFPSAMNSGL